jgi:hypothetical protein
VLGENVAAEPQAQLCFSFAVNLLARLHPVVQDLQAVIPQDAPVLAPLPRWSAPTIGGHATAFLEALRPPLRSSVSTRPNGRAGVCVILGSWNAGDCEADSVLFVGSVGWNASVSPAGPLPIIGRPNPVGAYAAACLAVAETWKRLLYAHSELIAGRPVVPLDTPLTFSTFTYESDGLVANPDLPDVLDVGRLTWIGLGAGGGAAAFTVASLPEVRGAVTLIEPDRAEEPNLNRYVYADAGDARASRVKTELIEHVLVRHSRLKVAPIPRSFSEVADALAAEDYWHVIAAVHSREARRQIQYETPGVLWDAGATDDGEFRIWRLVLGTTECMFCKHPPGNDDPETEKARQLSELLGLDPQTWLQKLGDNSAFTVEECAAIDARINRRERPFALPTVGQAFGAWEASQCGRLTLRGLDDEIPIPFAPVMAGVLLAGEIVKEACFPNAVLDSCYWNTLMGQFMRRNRAHRRRPRPGCPFCEDATYRDQYRRRWARG